MAFDFAKAKSMMRRAVHTTLSVSAFYTDLNTETPVELSVRWHNKIELQGDMSSAGYAEVIEGIERIILSKSELEAKNITPRRGGEVTILTPGWGEPVITLDSREPQFGPDEEIWRVSSK